MGCTHDFFAEKREWSEIKDHILRAYLRPYLAKICRTGKSVRIADCFAGKGRFEDGKDGSPIIICNAISEQLQRTPTASILGVFIEKKYVEDLRRNLREDEHVLILDGDYDDRMGHFIDAYDARKKNLLLYVDPYGTKSLRMAHFKAVANMPFHTVEVLVNFNARGFLREGCRLLKGHILEGEPIQEDYESDVSSPDALDAVAGGSYWRTIIEDYYKTHNLHEAEDCLVSHYVAELNQVFGFVVQFPVKLKLNHIAKYRMIYGTNHEDGLLLMADNMALRWKEFRDEARPQPVLFEMDFPQQIAGLGIDAVDREIINFVHNRISLKILLVHLVQIFGVSFSLSELKNAVKRTVEENRLAVTRVPDKKPSGRPIAGWDHTGRNHYDVYVERSAQWQQDLL